MNSSHIYKGFFWRFQGTSDLPPGISEHKVVEKLCPSTGRVLERFANINEAEGSVDLSCSSNLRKALRGSYNGKSHIYKEYFWRLKGSSHWPPNASKIQHQQQQSATDKKSTNASFANASLKRKVVKPGTHHHPNHNDVIVRKRKKELSKNGVLQKNLELQSWSDLKQMPVEKLCPVTGKVLRRFATAEAGRRSVSDSVRHELFKDALLGQNSKPGMHKGYFWRFQGSSTLPPGISKTQHPSANPAVPSKKKRKLDHG
jgi:hypothetical protein